MIRKKRLLIISAILPLLLCLCTSGQRDEKEGKNTYTYGSSTDSAVLSPDRIDRAPTYEVYFSLAGESECITVDINSAHVKKTFPVRKIPAKTYFIVEKVMTVKRPGKGPRKVYIPLAENFSSEWEVFSPLRICRIKQDPLSVLDKSEYRIRFTTIKKESAWFMITIKSDSPVTFR